MENQISPKEWMEKNRGKSLVDYYKEFPPNSYSNTIRTSVLTNSNPKNEQSTSYTYFPKKKSMLLTVFLTLFFGPFGLFYISFNSAAFMILLPIFVGLMFYISIDATHELLLLFRAFIVGSTIFLVMFYPVLCVIIGIYKTHKYNQNEDRKVHNRRY